jgi:L-glutamine-phosphate cytidylyltransferase
MRGIILAAGRGSRMGKMTDEKPKCLIELNGKTLIEHQLNAFKDAGIEDIALVTGYKRELLSKYGSKDFHNPRWESTNMVSSLLCADEWLSNYSCIISYSDIFYSSSAIDLLVSNEDDISITYDTNWLANWKERFNNPLDDAETFRIKDNYVTEIGNKPNSIDEIDGQYMGLLRFNPIGWNKIMSIIQEMDKSEFQSIHLTALLQRLIDSGSRITALPYNEKWGEVDSEFDFNLYNVRKDKK